jgi:hypothetical protein
MAFSEVTDDIEKQAPSLGEALSFVASADITAGQVVKLDGDQSVTPADTGGENAIGVATQTVASGDTLTVVGNSGRVRFTAAGAVSAGDPLTVDATTNNGEVGTASTTGDNIIGYALESAGSQGDTFIGVVDRGGEVN